MGNKANSSSLTKPEFAGIPYVRGRVLGKGSFGKVYVVQLAADKGFVRVVKEMHKSEILRRGEHTLAMLVHERELLTKLSGCPFVVRSLAATQDSQRLFMLLDFCSGGELVFHLHHLGHMSEEQVKFFAAELVVALDAMHNEYFIVHRDLKPENVLLDHAGHVSVIDFNIAKQCDPDGIILNPEGKAAGTMPYMAPEILRGKDHSAAIDWWSLGIMLYELRSGQIPFPTSGREKPIFCAFVIENITTVMEKLRASDELRELISGLLEVDPEKRWKAAECKKSAFFADVDWDEVRAGKLVAPITPDSTRVNFKADANMEEAFGLNKVKEITVTDEQQQLFCGWNWTREDQDIPQHLLDKINKVKEKKRAKENSLSPSSHSENNSSNTVSNSNSRDFSAPPPQTVSSAPSSLLSPNTASSLSAQGSQGSSGSGLLRGSLGSGESSKRIKNSRKRGASTNRKAEVNVNPSG